MSWVAGSPLLAAASWLDKPAVLGAAGAWSWRRIHEASIELARELAGATAVCCLCTSRVSFLATWLAALRSRRLLVLPPSGGQSDLAAVLQATERPFVVVDDARDLQPPWRDRAAGIVCRPAWAPGSASATELAWEPAWDDTAILMYTSGSTGAPVAQPKTLRHFAVGAQLLGRRLEREIDGGLSAIERIVCSVPPQHMFGVEGSTMLSLVYGMPVVDGRPLLPADVQAAFDAAPRAAWLATPLHLRSLVQADAGVPNCVAVIASTMPLAPALAREAEALVAAPVLEIYGSTETGALAMRRTARDAAWRPLDGVQLASGEQGAEARGRHFASPATLPDQVRLEPDGRFTLLGRQGDLVKIAGRRASLAGLNALLQEMPGLQDGVFHVPAGGETQRLCLIHAGPMDRAAADRWFRARLDPVFVPRTYIQLDRLPRTDNGKLPRQALEEAYAHWRDASRTKAGPESTFSVPADHPALAGHFPGRPIVPGALLLDHVLALAARSLPRPVTRLQHVKFLSPLQPGEAARVSFDTAGPRADFTVTALRDGSAVRLAAGTLQLAEPPREAWQR